MEEASLQSTPTIKIEDDLLEWVDDGVPRRRVQIVEDGDVTFRIKQNPTYNMGFVETDFLVCSKVMSRASPKLNTLLQEIKGNPEPRILRFSEEGDFESVSLLLNAAHSQFARVPMQLTRVGDLSYVLSFADAYELTYLLQPWLSNWLHSPEQLFDPSQVTQNEALYISWLLGYGEHFDKIAMDVIIEGKPVDGRLVGTNEEEIEFDFPGEQPGEFSK